MLPLTFWHINIHSKKNPNAINKYAIIIRRRQRSGNLFNQAKKNFVNLHTNLFI